MCLEKAIQFVTGFEAQQSTQFRLCNMTGLIFFDRKPFQRTSRQISSGCGKPVCKIVRYLPGPFMERLFSCYSYPFINR